MLNTKNYTGPRYQRLFHEKWKRNGFTASDIIQVRHGEDEEVIEFLLAADDEYALGNLHVIIYKDEEETTVKIKIRSPLVKSDTIEGFEQLEDAVHRTLAFARQIEKTEW